MENSCESKKERKNKKLTVMDDELEDLVLYQTFVSHMKLLSKFAVGIPSISHIWKMLRFNFLRPEVLLFGIVIFMFLLYLQTAELWGRGFFGRIQLTLGYMRSTKVNKLPLLTTSVAEKESWEIKKNVSACYAVQGRRPKMEDRYVRLRRIFFPTLFLLCVFLDL